MEKNKMINRIKSKNLIPIELENEDFIGIKTLKSNSIDELLEIGKDSGSKRVYFGYMTYDPSRFKLKYNPDTFSEKGCEKIELYNSHVETFDFTKPYKITVFIEIDSILLGIRIIDDWIQMKDLSDPDTILKAIEEEDEDNYHREFFDEQRKNRVSNKDNLEELLEIILSDPEFANKKNQQIRYWYFMEVMERNHMKKYIELLIPYGAPHIGNVKMFMDNAWRIYKERLKKEK